MKTVAGPCAERHRKESLELRNVGRPCWASCAGERARWTDGGHVIDLLISCPEHKNPGPLVRAPWVVYLGCGAIARAHISSHPHLSMFPAVPSLINDALPPSSPLLMTSSPSWEDYYRFWIPTGLAAHMHRSNQSRSLFKPNYTRVVWSRMLGEP